MTDIIAKLTTSLAERYQIERELGQGGMATVYLAHDVRHQRKVALKVLRAELAAILGGERFLQEIRTTANLQHPHILPLHDSGDADGTIYYVMPYVEGESLRQRLTREHQLPVDEAVRIAREIADALDYAHHHGVVHRDIKPENILLQGGHALVADFGIALAASRSDGGTRMTETGMSLGTPHYMSPEQAMGEREITAKADIYALGCVLYEMLTAEPPFTGATAQAIVARVMTEQPRSLTLQRRTIPSHVEAAVRQALEKLPADRFGSAAEFASALTNPAFGAGAGRAGDPAETARLPIARYRRAWPLVVAGVAVAFAGWGWMRPRPTALQPVVGRFEIVLPRHARYRNAFGHNIAVSPDGSVIVYTADGEYGPQLFARRLTSLEPVAIPGTEGAYLPFFSPDGAWLAFVSNRRLMKVPTSGGAALPIASLAGNTVQGASWGSSGTIVLEDVAGLYRVPAAGGRVEQFTVPDRGSGVAYLWPEFLPDGETIVFTVRDGGLDYPAAMRLSSDSIVRFDIPGTNPHYVAPGFLVLANRDGTISAVPFDAGRLRITGSPVPVFENVSVGGEGAARLAISPSGVVAYATGGAADLQLMEVDRAGAARALTAERRPFGVPRYSPDGRRIAVEIGGGGGIGDIWILDVAQGTLQRLTFGDSSAMPAWSPDGRYIAYARISRSRTNSANSRDLYRIRTDGTGQPESLLTSDSASENPGAFAPDGRSLAYYALGATARDVFVLSLDGRTSAPIAATAANEVAPVVSPDGRWIAYTSNESNRNEIYVRPSTGGEGKWQVSLNGGWEARWSPRGNELFYRTSGDYLLSARYVTQPNFAIVGRDTVMLRPFDSNIAAARYDISPDGRRLIMAEGAVQYRSLMVELHPFERLRASLQAASQPTGNQ